MECRSHVQARCAVCLIALLTATLCAVIPPGARATDDGIVLPGTAPHSNTPFQLENFTQYPLGTFPNVWKVRGRMTEAETIYRVSEEDGRRFLAARADGDSIMIGLERPFDPAEYPFMRWDWRVRQLPAGGDERAKNTNDSAAGVYVIFPGNFFLPRVLKYVWSTGAPVGTRESSPAVSSTKIIVIESGDSDSTQWRTATVNVKKDYETLFGSPPPRARGIGILTDGNDTSSVAAADYANFQLLRLANEPVAPDVSKAHAGTVTSDSN